MQGLRRKGPTTTQFRADLKLGKPMLHYTRRNEVRRLYEANTSKHVAYLLTNDQHSTRPEMNKDAGDWTARNQNAEIRTGARSKKKLNRCGKRAEQPGGDPFCPIWMFPHLGLGGSVNQETNAFSWSPLPCRPLGLMVLAVNRGWSVPPEAYIAVVSGHALYSALLALLFLLPV